MHLLRSRPRATSTTLLALSIALVTAACSQGPGPGADAAVDSPAMDHVDSAVIDAPPAIDVVLDAPIDVPPPDDGVVAMDAVDSVDVASDMPLADAPSDADATTPADVAPEADVAPPCPDMDGDGHRDIACGGDDCDDTDANRFPGNPEVCRYGVGPLGDGGTGLTRHAPGLDPLHDEDCDPTTFGALSAMDGDFDSDRHIDAACCNRDAAGVLHCGDDCQDLGGVTPAPPFTAEVPSGNVYPGHPEVCDGVDNDCNGMIDEGLPVQTWYRDCDGDTYGDPADPGMMACSPAPFPLCNHNEATNRNTDCNDANASQHPGAFEVCGNRIDDDCDGLVDQKGGSLGDSCCSGAACIATGLYCASYRDPIGYCAACGGLGQPCCAGASPGTCAAGATCRMLDERAGAVCVSDAATADSPGGPCTPSSAGGSSFAPCTGSSPTSVCIGTAPFATTGYCMLCGHHDEPCCPYVTGALGACASGPACQLGTAGLPHCG